MSEIGAPRNKMIAASAITLRPHGGLTKHHGMLLKAWLRKNASQWEFYEEMVDGDEASKHLHGRVLLKEPKRFDKLKESLITGMQMVLSEKRVLREGIKYLYDDQWMDYSSKADNVWDDNVTDEEAWADAYADPTEKWIKKKNAWQEHWLTYIEGDLGHVTSGPEVQHHMEAHIVNGSIEMGMLDTFKKRCQTLAEYWNMRNRVAARTETDTDLNCD